MENTGGLHNLDMISRQAILDMLEDINNHIIDGYGYRHDWCVEWVKGLPSIDIEDIIVSHEEIGYERGLRDGYAQAVTESDATEPQWIPCSERLPEVRQWVLCCCRTGTMDVLRLTNDGSWNKNYPHVDYMSDFVVAWMPLPEPYERKES